MIGCSILSSFVKGVESGGGAIVADLDRMGDKIENFFDTEMVKTNYLEIISREDVMIDKVGSWGYRGPGSSADSPWL